MMSDAGQKSFFRKRTQSPIIQNGGKEPNQTLDASIFSVVFIAFLVSAKRNVEHHHYYEAAHETNGCKIDISFPV